MAEARDFHCYSHVFENLGKETIPSDRTVEEGTPAVLLQSGLNENWW